MRQAQRTVQRHRRFGPASAGLRCAEDLSSPANATARSSWKSLRPAIALPQPATTYRFRVVSNDNVATFIKELVLEPEPGTRVARLPAGRVPAVRHPRLRPHIVRRNRRQCPFAEVWKAAQSSTSTPRTGCPVGATIPLPPPRRGSATAIQRPHQHAPARPGLQRRAASTYIHRLKPGDKITAIGPFGDFHIKPTEKEMVYLGGGAGMAPLRSHLAHLFEPRRPAAASASGTAPARCKRLSTGITSIPWPGGSPTSASTSPSPSPSPADNWRSYTGLIHEVLRENYLAGHADPAGIEYYVCGPPAMVEAVLRMLAGLKVDRRQIAFDEF